MNIKWGNVIIIIALSILCWSVDGISEKKGSTPNNLKPDKSDMNAIDEFLQSPEGKGNGHSPSASNPNRESLGNNETKVLTGENGEECKCVKYYSCVMEADQQSQSQSQSVSGNHTGGNGTEEVPSSQNIYNVVDIRKGFLRNGGLGPGGKNESGGEVPESLCESYFDICCPLKNIKEGGVKVNDTSSKEKDQNQGSTTPSSNSTSGSKGGHKSCGHRNEEGVGSKMTEATEGEAQFGEFPWTGALIQIEKNEDGVSVNKYIGGVSLIHPQVVMTVAHNVLGKNRSTLRVRLGEWDTQTNDEPYPSQDRNVQKVIIHEQFLLKTLYNDIALLILDEEAHFAPNVDTICLPPLNIKKLKFDGQMCFSAGWGKDNFGVEGRYSEIMKKVSVPVVPKDKCQEELSKSEKLPKFRLDKSFLCAGGEESGEDTCKGDGGSALVCSLPGQEHNHYVAVGLVSWGLGCKSTLYPGVYTDVLYFTPWILKQMDKEGMSTEFCSLQN